jgi:hypothetical protein
VYSLDRPLGGRLTVVEQIEYTLRDSRTQLAHCVVHCSQSNLPNRRWYVIRMPGGVGGEGP